MTDITTELLFKSMMCVRAKALDAVRITWAVAIGYSRYYYHHQYDKALCTSALLQTQEFTALLNSCLSFLTDALRLNQLSWS